MATSTVADNTRKRLADLLSQDLAFRGGDKPHPLHSIHAFAAKFPAQLPRHFIEGLSSPGEVVLDSMAGSGSTLVEGWLLSRRVIGVDLDPLALKLCQGQDDPGQSGQPGGSGPAGAGNGQGVGRARLPSGIFPGW